MANTIFSQGCCFAFTDDLSNSKLTNMAYPTMFSNVCHRLSGLSVGLLSVVALTGLNIPAAEAATFSLSGSQVSLKNFSLRPQSQTSTQVTDAIATTGNGTVNNTFEGLFQFEVPFSQLELNGFGDVRSQGVGTEYQGKARRQSNVLVEFLAQPFQPFSFDFEAAIVLSNTVSQPVTESALALARISLQLLAPDQTVLQFFNVSSGLNTNPLEAGINDFFQVKSSHLYGTRPIPPVIPDATEELGIAFLGRFEQTVTQPTALTLVVQADNQTCVQTPAVVNACPTTPIPEPVNFWGLGLILGLGLLRWSTRSLNSSLLTIYHP
jgi:hypothetical protein